MVSKNSMLEAFEAAPRRSNHGKTPGKTSVYCTVCRKVIWGSEDLCLGCRRSRNDFLAEVKPVSVKMRLEVLRDWKDHYRPMELATIWGREPW